MPGIFRRSAVRAGYELMGANSYDKDVSTSIVRKVSPLGSSLSGPPSGYSYTPPGSPAAGLERYEKGTAPRPSTSPAAPATSAWCLILFFPPIPLYYYNHH